MLRISKKGEEIIVRDIALTEFIQMGLLISATMFLLFFVRNDSSISFILLFAVLGLLVAGIYNLCFIQTKTVKIKKQKRILSINNRSLVKNISYVYRFGEITDLIFVDTFTDADGNKTHKLVFALETGERIELARAISSGKDDYFEAAKVINHFVFDNPKQIRQDFTGIYKL